MRTVVPSVEGHGEVQAVPVLLRRLLQRLTSDAAIGLARPIKVQRNRFLNKDAEFRRYLLLLRAVFIRSEERLCFTGCVGLLPTGNANASNLMAHGDFAQLWINPCTLVNSDGTASAETAPRRRIDGRGDVTLQDDALAAALRIGNRNRG